MYNIGNEKKKLLTRQKSALLTLSDNIARIQSSDGIVKFTHPTLMEIPSGNRQIKLNCQLMAFSKNFINLIISFSQ